VFIVDTSSEEQNVPANLKILGIGGGGSNVITYIYKQNLRNGYLIAANTDQKALSVTLAHEKIILGTGLGAGGDPEKGKKAMEASSEKMKKTLEGTDLLMLIATLGGGTGTGGIPVVAELAKQMGILSIGIVTLPFPFEGKKRMKKAFSALEELEDRVDTLLVIENKKLLEIAPEDISHEEAFHIADNMLYYAVRGITSIIFQVGYVNVDFADLETTIKNGGRAIMGSGIGTGENAVLDAVKQAIDNPLIKDGTMINAKNILVSFAGVSEKMTLKKINEAIDYIKERTNAMDEENEVFFGIGNFHYGQEPDYEVEVTIIATQGKDKEKSLQEESEHEGIPDVSDEGRTHVTERRGRNRRPAIFKKRDKNKE